MSLKVKLTVIILIMILVSIAVLSVFNLTRSSSLQLDTTHTYAQTLAQLNAKESPAVNGSFHRLTETYCNFY